MKVINLFGGPGTGKSTVAADLFALMKWNNINVELVNEYAKELTWERHHNILNDQLYVFSHQNRKLERLRDQVDYVITDCPLLMGMVYLPPLYYPHFQVLATEVWESYTNINIFLKRLKPYHTIGRNQTEDQAKELDEIIKNLLVKRWNPYLHTEVPADSNAKYEIFEIVKGHTDG